MNKAILLARRNYWIAGVGAIISAFSFLVLPFLTIGGSVDVSVTLLLRTVTKSVAITDRSVDATNLASQEGLVWVSLLLVVAVLVVSILFLVRQSPFGSQVPVQTQARWTALGFIGAGILSLVCLLISLVLIKQNAQGLIQNEVQSQLGGLSNFVHLNLANMTTTWNVGAYLFLAGLIAIVVAGLLEVRSPAKMLSDAEMGNAPQYPYTQYNYPPTPYGSNSTGQGAQPFNDRPTQYGGQSTMPYQPPPPPYGQ